MCVSCRWQHNTVPDYTHRYTHHLKPLLWGYQKKLPDISTKANKWYAHDNSISPEYHPQNTKKAHNACYTPLHIPGIHALCVHTNIDRAAIIIALQTYMSYYHFDVLQRWLAVQKCKYLSLGVLWPSPNRQGWCGRGQEILTKARRRQLCLLKKDLSSNLQIDLFTKKEIPCILEPTFALFGHLHRDIK